MMERLTSKKEADRQRRDYEKRLANGYLRNIPEERFLRLADYEDTCLTPAEVRSLWGEWNAMMSVLNSIGSYDRLRELAKADKDGRVTVLPCKVGDPANGEALQSSYQKRRDIPGGRMIDFFCALWVLDILLIGANLYIGNTNLALVLAFVMIVAVSTWRRGDG